MNAESRERVIYKSLTDADLTTPVGELAEGKRLVIEHVLRGPFSDDLMARIDRLAEGDTTDDD